MKKPTIGTLVHATALTGHKAAGICIAIDGELLELLDANGERNWCRIATVTNVFPPKKGNVWSRMVGKAVIYVLDMANDLSYGRMPSGNFQFLPTLGTDVDSSDASGILLVGFWEHQNVPEGEKVSERLVLRQVNDELRRPELHVVVQHAQLDQEPGCERKTSFSQDVKTFDPRSAKEVRKAIAFFVKEESDRYARHCEKIGKEFDEGMRRLSEGLPFEQPVSGLALQIMSMKLYGSPSAYELPVEYRNHLKERMSAPRESEARYSDDLE